MPITAGTISIAFPQCTKKIAPSSFSISSVRIISSASLILLNSCRPSIYSGLMALMHETFMAWSFSSSLLAMRSTSFFLPLIGIVVPSLKLNEVTTEFHR